MSEMAALEQVLWGFSFLLNVGLVFLLFYRKSLKVYPLFCIYALSAVLQNIAIFESYRILGFNSPASVRVAWGSQALITMTRAGAVGEVCLRTLAKYRGVWRLAWRLLLGAAAIVGLYAWASSAGSWRFAVLNLDRGLELVMASVIVLLIVFARSYGMPIERTEQALATGFFLYSAFRVLNDTMWGRLLNQYTVLWNFFGTVTYLASLLLWTRAFLRKEQEATSALPLLSGDHYRSLSPAVNARLRALNEHLGHFWRAGREET